MMRKTLAPGDKAKTDVYNTISDAALSLPPYQSLCQTLWQHRGLSCSIDQQRCQKKKYALLSFNLPGECLEINKQTVSA